MDRRPQAKNAAYPQTVMEMPRIRKMANYGEQTMVWEKEKWHALGESNPSFQNENLTS
jgi:hypothetical protein